ncbi:MAG: Maf family protein [Chloroflexota bacterium]
MTSSPSLVLASTSPRRRELLGRLGQPYTVVPIDVDETPLPGERPAQTAERLALAKARAARAALPADVEAVIVGADTIVVHHGHPLGKPETPAEAVGMLQRLRGETHRVISGVAVLDTRTGADRIATATTRVHLRPLTDAEIAAYVATGDPLDKAGAYAIQNREFQPVEWIEGCYSNVVGLPLCTLATELIAFGVEVAPEWQAGSRRCQCARILSQA